MKKTLVSRDKITGRETHYHHNEDGDDIVTTSQNVDSLIASNKREANEFRPGDLIGNTQAHRRKVAEIPTGLYHELLQKFGDPQKNPTEWRKWLNDYDNRFFRTDTGKM